MNTKIFKSLIFSILFFVIIYGHNGYPYGFTNRPNNTNNNLNQFYNSTGLPNCYCNGYKGPCDPSLPSNRSNFPQDPQPPRRPNHDPYKEFVRNYANYASFRELQSTKEHVQELVNKCTKSEDIKDLVDILELDDFINNYEILSKLFSDDILALDTKLLSFDQINVIQRFYNRLFDSANKARLKKIMNAYKKTLKRVQYNKDTMQLIVSNHDVSYKGNAYSIARTLLNDQITKDRINDPELIRRFAKKLFDFRFMDISKNLKDYYNGVNKGIVLSNLNYYLNEEMDFRKAFNYNNEYYDNIVLQAKNLVNRIEDSYLHSDFEKVLLDLNIKNRIDKIIVSDLRHNVKDFIEETLNQREQFVTNYNLPEKDFRTELGDKIIQASFTATQNCAITNNKSLTEHLAKNSLNALKFIYGFANEFGDKFANDLFMHIASMPLSYATGALVAYFGTPALLIVGGISIGFRIAQIVNGIPLSGEHFESFRQALGDENFILAGREYFKALQACGVVDITEDVISIFTGGGLINKGISKVAKITKLDNAAQTIIKNVKKISRLDKTVDLKVAKKFRQRAKKLKRLEECFEPVVNPDGTMSCYPPENKEQLFKRMDAQNQKSRNLTHAQKNRYNKLGIHHHRHDKIKKIIKDICSENIPKDLDETILNMQKTLTNSGLKIDAAHILLPEIDKNGYILGLHSDCFFKYFKDVEITNYKELPGGAWGAHISINGSVPTFKTFFPKGMSLNHITNLIKENFKKLDLTKISSKQKALYVQTDCGLFLKYAFNPTDSSITSVMPAATII